MSRRKKKLRNPSPELKAKLEQERLDREQARQPEQEELTPQQKRDAHDSALLEVLSEEQRRKWCEAGERLYGKLCKSLSFDPGPMTEEEVGRSLDTCTRFLNQVVTTASAIFESLDPNTVRQLVAADVPLSTRARRFLKAADLDLYEKITHTPPPDLTGEGNSGESSPQKRPRGARHPLMVLLGMALQSARLIYQITRGTWPEVHNRRVGEPSGIEIPGIDLRPSRTKIKL